MSAARLSVAQAERHNRRVGLWLFLVYLLVYGGFVATVAVSYKASATPVLWGLSLAIVWGLGLIVGAMVLALLYMKLAVPVPEGDIEGGQDI